MEIQENVFTKDPLFYIPSDIPHIHIIYVLGKNIAIY